MSVCVGISHSNFYPLDLHQEGILVQATMWLSQFMHLHKRGKKKKKKRWDGECPMQIFEKKKIPQTEISWRVFSTRTLWECVCGFFAISFSEFKSLYHQGAH